MDAATNAATVEQPEYLTVAEVSGLFRVSVPTIYRRCADGQLPHIRIGHDGPIRIPAGELERLYAQGWEAARRELTRGPASKAALTRLRQSRAAVAASDRYLVAGSTAGSYRSADSDASESSARRKHMKGETGRSRTDVRMPSGSWYDVDLQGIETKEQRRFHDRACHNP
jgi:excisionase family DNA binding protein